MKPVSGECILFICYNQNKVMMHLLRNDRLKHSREAESFTIVHSGKSRSTCTDAPWIRFTKRILAEHDPNKEILVTSAGMLHYDIVLRGWLQMGGFSRVFLHQSLAEWPECLQILYGWLENNPAIEIVQPDFPITHHSRSSAGEVKETLYFMRDQRVLSSASTIETGCLTINGRMHRMLKNFKRRSVTVRCRRLSRAEKSGEEKYTPGHYPMPECLRSFDEYVWHFTRTRNSPWPGETMAQYLDDLLGLGRTAPYSADTVLQRIVYEKRLRSSTYLVRGNIPVVCFSGASWGIVRNLFTWQNHLRRYRFEPYAIGIHKSELPNQGILPVIYAPEANFRKLASRDRWRFQKFDRDTVNWIDEAEWRSRGDVHLTSIPEKKLAVLTQGEIKKCYFGNIIAKH